MQFFNRFFFKLFEFFSLIFPIFQLRTHPGLLNLKIKNLCFFSNKPMILLLEKERSPLVRYQIHYGTLNEGKRYIKIEQLMLNKRNLLNVYLI